MRIMRCDIRKVCRVKESISMASAQYADCKGTLLRPTLFNHKPPYGQPGLPLVLEGVLRFGFSQKDR